MANLWVETLAGEWTVQPLRPQGMSIENAIARSVGAVEEATNTRSGPELIQAGPERARSWHLIAPPHAAVWINGMPLQAGIRVLSDRDEIHVTGARSLFFTTEELARVVAMPKTERPMSCPRCRQEIAAESAAVICPQCGIWHHQSEQLPCWEYAETCALCPQPTALDAGFQWTPVEL